MPLLDLPPEILAKVAGFSTTVGIARIVRTCHQLHDVKRAAVQAALPRLGQVQLAADGDAVDRLRGLEIEALKATAIVDTQERGSLSPPKPAASGVKFHHSPQWTDTSSVAAPHHLHAASVDVVTGGTLSKTTPLSGDGCFLVYRMVLENYERPRRNNPTEGVSSFIFVHTILEVIETYVPPHLRGAPRFGDDLVEAAFNHPLRFPIRPTCTFVSQSFLRRKPRSFKTRVDFLSTEFGQSVTARRRYLKSRPIADLRKLVVAESKTWTKPAMIEIILQHEIGFIIYPGCQPPG